MAEQTLIRELAFSHADCYRLIAATVIDPQPPDIDRHRARIVIPFGDGEITILLEPETTRAIGSLRLPLTRLQLQFRRLTQAKISEYLARFNRTFHRGGG